MDDHLTQLEGILVRLTEAHRAMGRCMAQELAALRRADHRAVSGHLEEENRHLQAIAEMEKERLMLTAELTRLVDPRAAEPMRLTELAQRLEEPVRGRLLGLGAQLRQEMREVQRQSETVRRASQSLLRHMQGLVRSIGAVVTGVAVYGQSGAPPQAALAMSTFEAKA